MSSADGKYVTALAAAGATFAGIEHDPVWFAVAVFAALGTIDLIVLGALTVWAENREQR